MAKQKERQQHSPTPLRGPEFSHGITCSIVAGDEVSQLLAHCQHLLGTVADGCITPLLQQLTVLLSKLGVFSHQSLIRLQ